MTEFYVYVIGTEHGPVKVGLSSNPLSRLSTLQTGSALKLELYYFREARDRSHAHYREKMFHDVYEDKRLAGEWFDMSAAEAAQGVDTGFDLELYREYEELKEYQTAALNIWCEPNGAHA